jgi:hypothetical protein
MLPILLDYKAHKIDLFMSTKQEPTVNVQQLLAYSYEIMMS